MQRRRRIVRQRVQNAVRRRARRSAQIHAGGDVQGLSRVLCFDAALERSTENNTKQINALFHNDAVRAEQ